MAVAALFFQSFFPVKFGGYADLWGCQHYHITVFMMIRGSHAIFFSGTTVDGNQKSCEHLLSLLVFVPPYLNDGFERTILETVVGNGISEASRVGGAICTELASFYGNLRGPPPSPPPPRNKSLVRPFLREANG